MTTDHNPRRWRPSASSAHRWLRCLGSHLAEQAIPSETSDAADEGTLLHSVIEGKTPREQLTRGQQWLIERALSARAELVESVFEPDDQPEVFREQRAWNRAQTVSGQADEVCASGDKYLVIDYKFGRSAVEDAATNLQLQVLAAILHDTDPDVAEVYVAIIQPRETPSYTVARYGPPQLRAAAEVVFPAAEAAMRPDAERKAGDWCKWCRARATCPQAQASVEIVAATEPTALDDPAKVARLLDACDAAEKVIEAIRERARVLALAGNLPGWTIAEGKVSIPALVDLVKRTRGLKGAKAEEAALDVLAGLIEETTVTRRKVRAEDVARERIAEAFGAEAVREVTARLRREG